MKKALILSVLVLSFLFGCSGNQGVGSEKELCGYLEVSEVCGSDGKTYLNSKAAECAGVNAMYPNPCDEGAPNCTDTDGGSNPDVYGEVSGMFLEGYSTVQDQCVGANQVWEFFCNPESLTGTSGKWEVLDCDKGEICEKGECVKITCKENDGGCKAKSPGTTWLFTKNGNYTLKDYCLEDGALVEFCCEDDGTSMSQYVECEEGYKCINGACAKLICYDTDGGVVTAEKGTVYGMKNGENVSATDSCSGKKTVIECSCNDFTDDPLDFNCFEHECPGEKMCSNGACIEPENATNAPCSDTDGGSNLMEKGTVSGVHFGFETFMSETDYCIGEENVMEFSCYADDPTGKKYAWNSEKCPYAYACENGACVGKLCYDDDGGVNLAFKGETQGFYGGVYKTLQDFCSGGNVVTEYVCEANTQNIKAELKTCPTSYSCVGGICVKITCSDSDGGKDLYTKGTAIGQHPVSFENMTVYDECINSTMLKEYTCTPSGQTNTPYGSTFTWDVYACTSGYVCSNGACVVQTQQPACKTAGQTCLLGRSGSSNCCTGLTCINGYCVYSR